MSFKMKFTIKKAYLPKGKRRPGVYVKPCFGVLHDTGNEGSTAANNVKYYSNTPNDPTSASAHTFIDDKEIIECVPLTLDRAERAHHVRYNVPQDNHLFGDDANDIGAGVELCWGGKINFNEAYKRYVWYCAYVSYVFKFNPNRWIGHEKLDPGRKTDPTNALKKFGKTYAQLLKDIIAEYNECTEVKPVVEKQEVKKPVIKEEDDKLELKPYMWEMAKENIKKRVDAKEIDSQWLDKVEKKQLTQSELAWLLLELLSRHEENSCCCCKK
jgi:N-acetylmuramoyl-L-alanine amidase